MCDDGYTRDLEMLLWMTNHNKPEYELTIIADEETKRYKIQQLKEMQEILERYRNRYIGITLRRVRKRDLPKE